MNEEFSCSLSWPLPLSPEDAKYSLSVTRNDNDKDQIQIHIHSVVPNGLAVSNGVHGRNVVATQFFPAGSILYRGYCAVMDTSHTKDCYTLYLHSSRNRNTSNAVESEDKKKSEETSLPSSSLSSAQPLPQDYDAFQNECFLKFELGCLNSVADSSANDKNNEDSSKNKKSIRQIYGFDGFKNHSCNPNVVCPAVYEKRMVAQIQDENPAPKNITTTDNVSSLEYEIVAYDTMALLDIHPGDEITCDYACYDFDCHGHVIEECGCHAPNCRGSMKGFRHLSLQEKVQIMHHCDEPLINRFARDNANICILESKIPNQIQLVQNGDEKFLVAAKTFHKGESIFQNQATLLTTEDCIEKTYILKLVQEQEQENLGGSVVVKKMHPRSVSYHLLDKDRHLIHRQSYVECLGFDAFMDHSCTPNAEREYQSAFVYEVRARGKIENGETITCDYRLLDNDN